MENPKLIFVTGATGHQGGALVSNLRNRDDVRLKVLVRDPASSKIESLKAKNVEIVQGDLDNPSSYKLHLKNVDSIFCVLTFIHGVEKEIRQGINLADAAKENSIRHFLYSSVIGADLHTGIPHWESKYKIEEHIKSIGLPYTIIRPGSFMENFLFPQVSSRIVKGKLVTPSNPDKVQQFISTEDIGKISAKIFLEPAKYMNKTINIATEQKDMNEVAAIFSETLKRPVKYQKLPGIITRLALGKDLSKMFRWVNNNDVIFVKDIPALHREFPGLTPLSQWVSAHFN